MAEISHKALFKLKTNSIIDLTQIRDWYDEIYTLSAKYSLAETYYQLGEFEAGFNTLALIPRKYYLNEKEMSEHNNYVALYTFKNSIRESGRTMAELTAAEMNQLLYFAEASQGLSAVMAQGLLCFFYDICIEEAEGGRQKAEGNDEMMRRLDDKMMKTSALENITLVPNPTTGELTMDNGELTIESVEIFDAYGKCHVARGTRHSSRVTLNISHLHSGIYFVKITTEVGIVVKKVVKQ